MTSGAGPEVVDSLALRRVALAAQSADQLVLEAMRLSAPIDRLPEFDGDTTMLWEQATVTPEPLPGTVHVQQQSAAVLMALGAATVMAPAADSVPLADNLVVTLARGDGV